MIAVISGILRLNESSGHCLIRAELCAFVLLFLNPTGNVNPVFPTILRMPGNPREYLQSVNQFPHAFAFQDRGVVVLPRSSGSGICEVLTQRRAPYIADCASSLRPILSGNHHDGCLADHWPSLSGTMINETTPVQDDTLIPRN